MMKWWVIDFERQYRYLFAGSHPVGPVGSVTYSTNIVVFWSCDRRAMAMGLGTTSKHAAIAVHAVSRKSKFNHLTNVGL